MKKLWILGFIAVAFLLFKVIDIRTTMAQVPDQQSGQGTQMSVNPAVAVQDPKRIGMNIAHWTVWGPEQFSRNILMNPGFEGKIDRIVAIVSRTDENSFSDQRDLGQQDGYWVGGTFDIRSGPYAGTKGTITNSLRAGADGLPQYFTDSPLPPLNEKDIIIVTKVNDSDPVSQWWIPDPSIGRVLIEPNETRPGSGLRGGHSLLECRRPVQYRGV